MSATLATPDIHRWVDKLSPAQAERLKAVAENDEILPAIEASDVADYDSPVENWLRTTVRAACERHAAGLERTYTSAEVHEMLEARRAERSAKAA